MRLAHGRCAFTLSAVLSVRASAGSKTSVMGDVQKLTLPARLGAALRLHARSPEGVNALHIFDFDGTLIRTPMPEEGRASYLAATGRPWPVKGWWGRVGSLSPPVLESPLRRDRVIRCVWDEFEDISKRSATACAVVMTGRVRPLRPDVLRILGEATEDGHMFLDEDAVFTHPGGRMDMWEWKTTLIYSLVASGPLEHHPIRTVHIWEDRKEHAERFESSFAMFMKDKCDVHVNVHFVTPEMS